MATNERSTSPHLFQPGDGEVKTYDDSFVYTGRHEGRRREIYLDISVQSAFLAEGDHMVRNKAATGQLHKYWSSMRE